MSLEELSPHVEALKNKLSVFVEQHCIPAEREFEDHMKRRFGKDRWTMEAIPPCVERLKQTAKSMGLWNLFIPPHLIKSIPPHLAPSCPLSFREYGILCETMGRSFLAPEACNCNAPDTGNMEVLMHHGTEQQKQQYLIPLLEGKIRSAFLMTEPSVASSDATNIQSTLTRIEKTTANGPKVSYILNGQKWWSTGAMDPRCKVALVLCRMDYSQCQSSNNNNNNNSSGSASNRRHGAHTVVLIDMNNEGVEMVRPLTVFGYDDAPHGHAEVKLTNIQVSPSDLIIGEGSGFQVAQSRLGPGRIHHCMRSIGLAQRCYEYMLERSLTRRTFGKLLCEHGGCQEQIADSVADLEAARLLTLSCAAAMDTHGARGARDKIASIKVAVPELTGRVVDRAVQIFGGAGVSDDFPLARALAGLRSLRIADGPDAVHKRTVALMEIKKAKRAMKQHSRL